MATGAVGTEGGTRKARKSRGERGGKRETPIVGKATLTLRPFYLNNQLETHSH